MWMGVQGLLSIIKRMVGIGVEGMQYWRGGGGGVGKELNSEIESNIF